MKKIEKISHSPKETREFGIKLAAGLEPGSIVGLYGELGSGKTCLAGGMARGMGVKDTYLPSPTFVLVREYQGHCPVYHMDFYRLTEGSDLDLLGLDEYFFGLGITIIEWAERIDEFLPPGSIRIKISHLGGDTRRIVVHEDIGD